jgi:hypothetical protein
MIQRPFLVVQGSADPQWVHHAVEKLFASGSS